MARGADGGGLIFAVGHVGSNDAVAAAIARHGMPISVVADDSSFPSCSSCCAASARRGASRIIAVAQPARDLRRPAPARDAGLLVDWGYRADGIPVRLFGAWTALPAGPATLAAKTGSRILPVTIRRQPDGTFHVSWPASPIEVRRPIRPSSSARPRRSPTRSSDTSRAAPEQWYSFKPIWPATAEEAADLERRARPDAGGRRRTRAGAGSLDG